MSLLNKANILQGVDSPRKVKIEALDGEIYPRPLSSAEVNEILHIEAEGYGTFNATSNRGQTMADGKLNLTKMQEKQAEAKYTAIHKSINNDKNTDEWSFDELQLLPSNAINEIYDQVMKLSGADVTERDVKNFPENE